MRNYEPSIYHKLYIEYNGIIAFHWILFYFFANDTQWILLNFYVNSTRVSNHQQALSTFFLLNIWEVGEPCFHFFKFISLSSVDSKQNKSTYERKPSFFFHFKYFRDLRSKQVPVNQYELRWTPQLWNKSITKAQPLYICFNSTITFFKICNGYYNVLGVKKREGAITNDFLVLRKGFKEVYKCILKLKFWSWYSWFTTVISSDYQKGWMVAAIYTKFYFTAKIITFKS